MAADRSGSRPGTRCRIFDDSDVIGGVVAARLCPCGGWVPPALRRADGTPMRDEHGRTRYFIVRGLCDRFCADGDGVPYER